MLPLPRRHPPILSCLSAQWPGYLHPHSHASSRHSSASISPMRPREAARPPAPGPPRWGRGAVHCGVGEPPAPGAPTGRGRASPTLLAVGEGARRGGGAWSPPRCAARLRVGCAAPGGGDVGAQGGSPYFRGARASGCCGVRCDPRDGGGPARDVCVLVCFVCVPNGPSSSPHSAGSLLRTLGRVSAPRCASVFSSVRWGW